ncbi:glycosidase [Verrucomicrobia bacterium S94]|nr:glycosidase [Verrucomicrobia bacterium S94]
MAQPTRKALLLHPDVNRVFFRPFMPSSENRTIKIIARVMSLSESRVKAECARVLADFEKRHSNLRAFLLERFDDIKEHLIADQPMSEARKLLLGAYFTQEYALEAAALFNPSIVPHPDQSGTKEGELRFILSLRSTGEGHISSITFRTGSVDASGSIQIDPTERFVTAARPEPNPTYEKELFLRKLGELGLQSPWVKEVTAELKPEFTLLQLEEQLQAHLSRNRFLESSQKEAATAIRALAHANYELRFNPDQPISQRAIFPSTPAEKKGLEDARFVAFRDGGKTTYYATYTAYDGHMLLPQILQTDDFVNFRISTLNGSQIQNKGMALFPRKINGRYAMISRQDNENLFLMYSDHPHFWYEKQALLRPSFPWEFMQIGNCGSPIETEQGWLLITHGVGPMRRYTIGAILLDLDDPSKVIGRLKTPLLSPNEQEREGYVPNVVYSCGALIHSGRLILPYAVSDRSTTFATYELDQIFESMNTNR